MLNAVEELVVVSVKRFMPGGLDIVTGTSTVPTSDAPQVGVHATLLAVQFPEATAGPTGRREPARALRRLNLPLDPANPNKTTYALPPDALPELIEVQSPPGHLLHEGDQYQVDGTTIHFVTAPVQPVTLLTRGAIARGWRDLLPCQIDIVLTIWATAAAQADALAGPLLAASLSAFVGCNVIELTSQDSTGFLLRLTEPIATLAETSSTNETVGTTRWRRLTIRVAVSGTLELTLATAPADPEGLIQTLEYRLSVRLKSGM